MKCKERLIRYAKFDTTSHEGIEEFPSTKGQLVLANALVEELKEIGVADAFVDEYGYVYGSIPANVEGAYAIGLLAHMDTSDQVSGANVNPQVHENYDGNDIVLNPDVIMKVERFPFLKELVGKTLITSDGNTLLGADDKAGIAIIMEVLETYLKRPDLKHGLIRVCFSPDEEIGRGMEHFNYDLFKVDFAYTLDGGETDAIEYECFNAASAVVEIKGISSHPGDAKGKMINALNVAHEFHTMIPADARPEYTEGREGFNSLMDMSGSVDSATLNYIIRNHDAALLEKQKQDFINAAAVLNNKYPEDTVKLTLKDSYRNMREKFEGHYESISLVKTAVQYMKMDYKEIAIRGGTDGAELSWHGLLTPNLGTGGHNYHGIYECCTVEDMEKMVKLVIVILTIATRK